AGALRRDWSPPNSFSCETRPPPLSAMRLTEKKTESTPPLLQGVKRSNFIRAAAMEWMRINQPDVMAQIEAEAERQYPFRKAAAVDPIHNGLVDNQCDVQNRQAEQRGGGDRDCAD